MSFVDFLAFLTFKSIQMESHDLEGVNLFIYLFGVLCHFQHTKVISRWVVGKAEETSTYSWSRFCSNGKQLPAVSLEVGLGSEPRCQR